MAETIIETIQSLLKLKEIDEKLVHLNGRIQDGPRILSSRKADCDDARKGVERKMEAIKELKVESKNKETELKGKEEEIKKLEMHLLAAKTNQEYSGLQEEIARLRAEGEKLEEAILESFDRVEAQNKELADMERELELHEKELEEFTKGVERDNAEYQKEIEEYLAKRKDIQEKVHFEAANLYEKVKKARGGPAVVSADGQTCGGCYMTVTANDIARLRNMKEIVLCKSCQRILFLSELIQD